MDKKWDIAFTCGMIGCDYDDFIKDLDSLSSNEFYYTFSKIGEVYNTFMKEHDRRKKNNGY